MHCGKPSHDLGVAAHDSSLGKKDHRGNDHDVRPANVVHSVKDADWDAAHEGQRPRTSEYGPRIYRRVGDQVRSSVGGWMRRLLVRDQKDGVLAVRRASLRDRAR